MKKWSVGGILVLACLGGCGFAQGFRDESARQAAEIAAEYAIGKVGGDVAERINDFKDALPKKEPINDGLLYSAGALLAYVVGSYGKGKLRERASKGKAA